MGVAENTRGYAPPIPITPIRARVGKVGVTSLAQGEHIPKPLSLTKRPKSVSKRREIKTSTEYIKWQRTQEDMPSNPHHTYKGKGWIDWKTVPRHRMDKSQILCPLRRGQNTRPKGGDKNQKRISEMAKSTRRYAFQS